METEKMLSCPICGYTDTATDKTVLEGAIEEHVRTAHNQTTVPVGQATNVIGTDDGSASPQTDHEQTVPGDLTATQIGLLGIANRAKQ